MSFLPTKHFLPFGSKLILRNINVNVDMENGIIYLVIAFGIFRCVKIYIKQLTMQKYTQNDIYM